MSCHIQRIAAISDTMGTKYLHSQELSALGTAQEVEASGGGRADL